MHKQADQRSKVDLDLFLVALLEEGIDTPYRMQKEAGISQGTSLQSLKRLVGREYVKASIAGPRGRVAFRPTATGRRWLRSSLVGLSETNLTGDFDSVLRKGLLIAYLNRDPKTAAQLFRAAASERQNREKAPASSKPDTKNLAEMYAHFRHAQASLLATGEVEVLVQAAKMLARSARQRASDGDL